MSGYFEKEREWNKACRAIGGDTTPKAYDELVCKTKGGELTLVMQSPPPLHAEDHKWGVEFKGGVVAGRIDGVVDIGTRETESGETVMVVSNEDAGVELGMEQTILRR